MPLGIAALGKGNGKFEPPVTYPVEVSSPTGVALGDLRKNGLTDIVAGQIDATSVLLNKGKGKFSDGLWAPLAGANSCGASADFNGDGKPDLAVPRSAGMTIMPVTGKASAPYTTGATIATPGPGCPITGDLNGDGIPDLLFLTSGGGFRLPGQRRRHVHFCEQQAHQRRHSGVERFQQGREA